MENYILQILENNNRVIVPEFGAFIVKQRDPLTIIFNEFLQYNDGMLVDFISKKESISRDDAKAVIDNFVSEVTKSLKNDVSFSLGKLGVIAKNTAGKISIEKEANGNKQAEKAKKIPAEKKSAPKTDLKKETKEPEAVKTENAAPAKKDRADEKQGRTDEELTKEAVKDVKPEQVTQSISTGKSDVKAPVGETVKEKPKVSLEEQPPVKKAEPVSELKTQNSQDKDWHTKASVPPKKKKRKNFLLWVIIIVLVNGILITYFVLRGEFGSLFKSDASSESVDYFEQEVLQPEKPVDDAAEDITAVEEEIVSEPVAEQAPPPKKVVSGTRYYIVAGVFGSEQNADNLVKSLRSKGYNAEKFGKIGNLHAVSYSVYTSKEAADQELKKIQNEINPEAWIRTVK